jgi:ferric-dicitrate binding protein FerR (iron transport regulator)
MISCKPGNTKKTDQQDQNEGKDQPFKFNVTNTNLIFPGTNTRLRAIRYSLPSLPVMDSINLEPVYLEYPFTDGNFYLLKAARGEQYNIALDSGGQLFLNAATLLFLNHSPKVPHYIVQGKVYFNTSNKSALVQADECSVYITPHTKVNIENYATGKDIIISLLQGIANVKRYDSAYYLEPNQELWLNKSTGKIIIKLAPKDVATWTSGWVRQSGMGNDYIFRELSRLYKTEISFEGAKLPNSFNSIEYRHQPLDSILLSIAGPGYFEIQKRNDSIYISKQ